MMMLGKPFFDSIRRTVTGGHLSAKQVDGLNRIMAEWERRKLTDLRWLANILAQSFWESDRTWQPILESGGKAYLQSKAYYPYIGAGLIQVTWRANYQKFGAEKPKDLLGWPIALRALFDGMIDGLFTKHKLADFFNATKNDPIGARKIVNGTDRAEEIAAIHRHIHEALTADGALTAEEPDNKTVPVAATAAGAILLGIIQWAFSAEHSKITAALLVVAIIAFLFFMKGRWPDPRAPRVEIIPPSKDGSTTLPVPGKIIDDPEIRVERAKHGLRAWSIEMDEAIEALKTKQARIAAQIDSFEFKLIDHEAKALPQPGAPNQEGTGQ